MKEPSAASSKTAKKGKTEEWVPVPKYGIEKVRITKAAKKCWIFQGLDAQGLENVILASTEQKVSAEEEVIKQGDKADS